MSTSLDLTLLSNGSATSAEFDWPGGEGSFQVKATWGGGSVSLQYRLPDGSTYDLVNDDCVLSADGGALFVMPAAKIKAVVAGSVSAIYARAAGTGR